MSKPVVFIPLVLMILMSGCKTVETQSITASESRTVAQVRAAHPDGASLYPLVDTSEAETVYVVVDEFPRFVNGLLDMRQRINQIIEHHPTGACKELDGERILFQFIVNEQGHVEKISDDSGQENNNCIEEVQKAITVTAFTPAKVRGKPVKMLFGTPVVF
ncbi:MAG: energy transducer TonB [Balneolaceae bacterium]